MSYSVVCTIIKIVVDDSSFQHKVGLFYDAESLNSRITARSLVEESPDESYSNVKCYACDLKKVCLLMFNTRHSGNSRDKFDKTM